MNNFDIVFDRDNARITIFDISRCSSSNRRLQSEGEANEGEDPYELPQKRETLNVLHSLYKIRVKYSNSL
jgi:hypothetical protein